jgi:hypothetical protein
VETRLVLRQTKNASMKHYFHVLVGRTKRARVLGVAKYSRVLFSQVDCCLSPFTQKSTIPRGASLPNSPAFVWITCTTLASTVLSLLELLTSWCSGSRPGSACKNNLIVIKRTQISRTHIRVCRIGMHSSQRYRLNTTWSAFYDLKVVCLLKSPL